MRYGQSIHDLKSVVEEMAGRANTGMEPVESHRVCLEPFINALTNEKQRRNVRFSIPNDLDKAAEEVVMFESALKTEARKIGTHPMEVKEIRTVVMDTGENKNVKCVEKREKCSCKKSSSAIIEEIEK